MPRQKKAGCVDHLLAIRSRLRDLIICRDELARLERREALGKDWPTGMRDRDSVIGGSGNDLVFRVDYHVAAALNAMSSILDNLRGSFALVRAWPSHRSRSASTGSLIPAGPLAPPRPPPGSHLRLSTTSSFARGLRCEHSAILPTIGLAWITGGPCRATQASPRLEVPRCSPPGYQETSPLMACLMAPFAGG